MPNTTPPDKPGTLAELLPCPFCGGEWITIVHPANKSPEHVGCKGCLARGPLQAGWTEAEAIAAWNTRTPPANRNAVLEEAAGDCHGLDTPERVCFYEQDFYVLSNFSSFSILWDGVRFDTSEHLYHWLKFITTPNGVGLGLAPLIAREILNAPSAHEAFKIAERNRDQRRGDWDDVKVGFMRQIIRTKAEQHEYVRRKLLATGDRELVENSWRDDFWGWGPSRDGQNMLGRLWMEVRSELRALQSNHPEAGITTKGEG